MKFVFALVLFCAAALAQGPQQPVVAGQVTLGGPCIPGSPFYANLSNGQMVSCQQVGGTGPFVWALPAAGSAPPPPPASPTTPGIILLPPNATTPPTNPVLGTQPSGVQGFSHQNVLSLGCSPGQGVPDDTACLQSAISTCSTPGVVGCSLEFPYTGNCFITNGPIYVGNGSQYQNIDISGLQLAYGANGPVSGTCIQQNTPGQSGLVLRQFPGHGSAISIRGLVVKYPTPPVSGLYTVSGSVLTAITGTLPTTMFITGGEATIFVQGSSSWTTPCLSSICYVAANPSGNTVTLYTTSALTTPAVCTVNCASATNPNNWAVGGIAIHFPYQGNPLNGGVTLERLSLLNASIGLAADWGLQSCKIDGVDFHSDYIGWNAGGGTNNCTVINNVFQSGTTAIHIPAGALFANNTLIGNVIENQLGPSWLVGGQIQQGSEVSTWHEFALDDIYRTIGTGSISDLTLIDPRWDGSTLGIINLTTLGAGGSGYNAGDLFTVNGAGPLFASGVVNTVSSGAVATYTILTRGDNYTVANGVATTATSGTGSGLTVNITGLGPNAFNMVNNVSSSARIQNINIIGGFFANYQNGYLTYVATDPLGSADPGYNNWNIADLQVGSAGPPLLKGFHTMASSPGSTNYVKSPALSPAQVVNNSWYGVPAPFEFARFGAITYLPGPTGRPLQWASYKVTYNTVSTNFTIATQNGVAATTVAAPAAATLNLTLFASPSGLATSQSGVQGVDIKGVFVKSVTACTGLTTLAITGFGTNGNPALFASTTTPTGYVLNYDLMAAVGATNLYDPPFLNAGLGTAAVQNIVVRVASTGGNINAITNNCAFNVDVLWSPVP